MLCKYTVSIQNQFPQAETFTRRQKAIQGTLFAIEISIFAFCIIASLEVFGKRLSKGIIGFEIGAGISGVFVIIDMIKMAHLVYKDSSPKKKVASIQKPSLLGSKPEEPSSDNTFKNNPHQTQNSSVLDIDEAREENSDMDEEIENGSDQEEEVNYSVIFPQLQAKNEDASPQLKIYIHKEDNLLPKGNYLSIDGITPAKIDHLGSFLLLENDNQVVFLQQEINTRTPSLYKLNLTLSGQHKFVLVNKKLRIKKDNQYLFFSGFSILGQNIDDEDTDLLP